MEFCVMENKQRIRNILAISAGFFLTRLLEINGLRAIVQELLVIGVTGCVYWLLRKRLSSVTGALVTFLIYFAIRFVQYRILDYFVM